MTCSMLNVPIKAKGLSFSPAILFLTIMVSPMASADFCKTARASIEIEAPARTVFQTITDVASYPEWNPFILRTLPRERGKEKWAIVSSLKPFFNIPPDFKRDGLDITGLLEIISEGNLSNGTFFSEYENAKHLPLWGHCHPDLIVNVLTMFWIEKNGLGIYDYYDSTDTNFLITMAKGFKESVVNEHFESIPEEIRYRTQGKLINVEEYKKNYMNPPE